MLKKYQNIINPAKVFFLFVVVMSSITSYAMEEANPNFAELNRSFSKQFAQKGTRQFELMRKSMELIPSKSNLSLKLDADRLHIQEIIKNQVVLNCFKRDFIKKKITIISLKSSSNPISELLNAFKPLYFCNESALLRNFAFGIGSGIHSAMLNNVSLRTPNNIKLLIFCLMIFWDCPYWGANLTKSSLLKKIFAMNCLPKSIKNIISNNLEGVRQQLPQPTAM